jgi:predicted DNA-binding transcriptional regulator YafY
MVAVEKFAIIMQEFHTRIGAYIDSYDEILLEKLKIQPRQLARDLESISKVYSNIVVTTKDKRKVYKLIKPVDVIKEAFTRDFDLGMLFEMAIEYMPNELLEDWNEISKKENKHYRFYNMPYEDIKMLEKNSNFLLLKKALENKFFITIELQEVIDKEVYIDVIPYKIAFIDGNWYIIIIENSIAKVIRIQFIKNIKLSQKKYVLTKELKYKEFLDNLQNAMTIFNTKSKKAILIANKEVAKYFKPNMKKFFKSQKFLKAHNNGDIEFEISYTQELEILPFIQKWIPNIKILEPQELKNALKEKLELYNI